MTTFIMSIILSFYTLNISDSDLRIDLSGNWTVTGKTQHGYLSYDWSIKDSNDQIKITKKSRYGNNDINQKVIEYSKSNSRVYIKIFEDVGVGPTTSIYSLEIINKNLLSGTLEMKSEGIDLLPSITTSSSINITRK